RHLGGDDWALHVPVGKLHNDRWTPGNGEVRELIARLRFLATLSPAADNRFLLPYRASRATLCQDLRRALTQAASRAGIAVHIVPHQLRHTYATTMLRAGVSLPALMKLLGHRTANMTLRYVEVTQKDLQREFHRAQQNPRHLIPAPAPLATIDPDLADAPAIVERLSGAIRVLDLFRLHDGAAIGKPIQLLLRRLVRVRSAFQKLIPATCTRK
ncbi:MAG: tyrosine-type recombinase/integrase, partial [Acidobacteriota bacterium]|nr:tyrosine-type recombinase/integrase [Acidobacteriota bacterium]